MTKRALCFSASSLFVLLINSNCPIMNNLLHSHTLRLDGDRPEEMEAPVTKAALIENDGTFVPLNGTHSLVWSHKRRSCFQSIQWSQCFPCWLCNQWFPGQWLLLWLEGSSIIWGICERGKCFGRAAAVHWRPGVVTCSSVVLPLQHDSEAAAKVPTTRKKVAELE